MHNKKNASTDEQVLGNPYIHNQSQQNRSNLSYSIDIKTTLDWKKCSIISNFFGKYLAEDYKTKKNKIISTISTITNELLENAIKFSPESHKKVTISLSRIENIVTITTLNLTKTTQIHSLKHAFERLEDDIDHVHLKRIIENTEHYESNSEIGLMVLIKEFNLSIGAKLTPANKTPFTSVEIIASLDINKHL